MKKLTEQIRLAVAKCGMTNYRICKEAGIQQSTLSKFMLRQRGLSMEAMDAIGKVLRLRIRLGVQVNEETQEAPAAEAPVRSRQSVGAVANPDKPVQKAGSNAKRKKRKVKSAQ